MKPILNIIIFISALLTSAAALAWDVHEDKAAHEEIIALQELVALGCMGKLNITPNENASYSDEVIATLQKCTDLESSDLIADVLRLHEIGKISKERAKTFLLHNAAIFAKQHNGLISKISVSELIEAAKEMGSERYPHSTKLNN